MRQTPNRSLTRVGVLVALIITALYWLKPQSDHHPFITRRFGKSELADTSCGDPSKCAYAALLCDDELLPALRVLLYSLIISETKHPRVVFVLPGVSGMARSQILALDAEVREVPQLVYPFEGLVRFEAGINKQCRYSKLHLWSETRFNLMVYLDVDVSIQRNIDKLFQRPVWFAGVRDIGDVINTGVMVLKPSQTVFNDMIASYQDAPSYNRGDQGFLNWYFSNRTQYGVETIAHEYNVPGKLKGFAKGKELINHAYAYHFTAETKPWSFHTFYHPDWRVNYHPVMFAKWRALDFHVAQQLRRNYDVLALPRAPSPLRKRMADQKWQNWERQLNICEGYAPTFELTGIWPLPGQYSVAIAFSNPERLKYLPTLIEHYWRGTLVHMVYVTWHLASIPVPLQLRNMVEAGRLVILQQKSDSLNNRFNPIPGLLTEAVFICDDDIFIEMQHIDFAFSVWQGRPEAITGFFPRVHGMKPDGSIFYDMAGPFHTYSMMLTKAMMLSANQYNTSTSSPTAKGTHADTISLVPCPYISLHAYTCVLAPEIHRFVDMGKNCEDMAMNMMVTGLTGAPPICVAAPAHDFGTNKGISITGGFTHRRDECVEALIQLFGRDTLKYNTEMVSRFQDNEFYKQDWSILETLMGEEISHMP